MSDKQVEQTLAAFFKDVRGTTITDVPANVLHSRALASVRETFYPAAELRKMRQNRDKLQMMVGLVGAESFDLQPLTGAARGPISVPGALDVPGINLDASRFVTVQDNRPPNVSGSTTEYNGRRRKSVTAGVSAGRNPSGIVSLYNLPDKYLTAGAKAAGRRLVSVKIAKAVIAGIEELWRLGHKDAKVNEAFRNYALQKQYYNSATIAAHPAVGNHRSGEAIDINLLWSTLGVDAAFQVAKATFAKYGLYNGVPGDLVHFSPNGN